MTKLNYGEERGIKIYGKMLNPLFGIYAVRLINSVNNETIIIIDPLNIDYESSTKEWVATIIGEETLGSSDKHFEIFVRHKPETIEYGVASGEKNLEKNLLPHLKLAMRVPCFIFPDENQSIQDEEDRMKKNQEKILRGKYED